jgi:hypothetical protein
VLSAFVVSRTPLSESDLAGITGLDQAVAREQVILPLRAFLTESPAGYGFYHHSFGEFVRKEIADAPSLKAAHAAVATWLLAPGQRTREYRWRSLAYHLYESGDAARFKETIDDAFLHEKVRRFGFAVLEDVELLTRSMIESGEPRLAERGVSMIESLRAIAGGDLMADVERAVQFAQAVPRPDRVGVSNLVVTPHVELFTALLPRIGVSADFVEVVPAGDSVWVAIGDVPASGLKSAFVARFAATLFRRLVLAAPDVSPHEVLGEIGHTMGPFGNRARMSMQCVRIDTARGRLRVSSAGHPFPVRYAATRKKSDRLLVRGPLLNGADSHARQYDVRSAEIAPGDILVLVSDGLTESSRADDPYGYRFVDIVEEHASEPARSIGERIIADWRRHPRNPDWIDDVSVVVAVISRSGGSDEH